MNKRIVAALSVIAGAILIFLKYQGTDGGKEVIENITVSPVNEFNPTININTKEPDTQKQEAIVPTKSMDAAKEQVAHKIRQKNTPSIDARGNQGVINTGDNATINNTVINPGREPRKLTEIDRQRILNEIPSGSDITLTYSANHTETKNYTEEIYYFISSNGYNVVSIETAVYLIQENYNDRFNISGSGKQYSISIIKVD